MMDFNSRAQRLWRTTQTTVPRVKTAQMLKGQHNHVLKQIKKHESELTPKGHRMMSRAAYSLLIDSMEVEAWGTYPITELTQ